MTLSWSPCHFPIPIHHSLGLYNLPLYLALGTGNERKKVHLVPFKSIHHRINLRCFYSFSNNINLLGKMAARKLISPLAWSLPCNCPIAFLSYQ